MRVCVRFCNQSAEFDVADDRLVKLVGAGPSPAIADVPRAVADAIESPIEFPPLRRAVVPGDHVAVVLDNGVPLPADVLGPVIECLREAGAEPHDIQVIDVPALSGSPSRLTADALPPGIALLRHDPSDRTRLSYLATTTDGTRVYLNRVVVDADLVVLVGRVDFDPILGYRGTTSGVFPGLVDDVARQAFRMRVHKPVTRQSQALARREADEIAWLLGVQFAVAVVAGRADDTVAVSAGACSHVQREAERRLNESWQRRAERRVDSIVAAISGDAAGQGFDELGRVLDDAMQLVSEGGRVVVLSAIDAEPGPALRATRSIREPAKALERLHKLAAHDVISTRQIARASQFAHVYLLSRLDDELVEDVGMTPIGSVTEVQRLVDQAAQCTIVNDAQLARVRVEEDDGKSAE